MAEKEKLLVQQEELAEEDEQRREACWAEMLMVGEIGQVNAGGVVPAHGL